ncbi:hypothetical protein [Longimicrobium sp.]|uniref:hypothetical protein n=1 Tax=Longimicrobium sp. TaxID=2029185 RepID=UPI002E368F56|nr:hypothetical protein [Longimicrobium sp.]HEX6036659.1 hypothetical protein [Longimicrobium sp.]
MTNRLLIRVLVLMSLVAVSACKGDGQAEEEQGSAGFVLPGEEPYVSPEDSARAAEDVQARSDAVRDSLRRATGGEREEDDARPTAASGESAEARYRMCTAQAAQADAGMRERLQAACENIRAQSPDAAPTP